MDDRYHRELDRRKREEEEVGAEEVAERLKRDYGRKNAYGARGGFGDTTVVPKRLLLPSVDDPSIWAVRCREGKEFEVVNNIMKKIEEASGTDNALGIISAFERTQVGAGIESINKGYIYIEAMKREPVELALDGVLDVYPRTKMFLVEIKEMPDLLRVQPPVKLEPGAFVRIRRPKLYEGDLGEIQQVDETGLSCFVRLVPRIDYSAAQRGFDPKRKRPGMFSNAPRPPPRLFNEVEARKRAPRDVSGSTQSGTWYYKNDQFVNGYLIKEFKLQNLETKNVVPTLEEIERFSVTDKNEGTQNLDMAALATSLKESNASIAYLPGDTIEVFKGEQKGLFGRVTNVQGEIVTLQALDGELLGQTIEVPARTVRKRFRVGDHVKVTSGSRYQDEVGVVVFIEEDKVTFVTDGSKTHITVFSKDLREADDTGGTGTLGQYSMLDLVQLDATSVGVIVKVDREFIIVLDQDGNTKQVRPTQIANVIPKKKLFVAADRNGSEIRYDDVVKEYGGQQRQGKIIHIHRNWVWLHNYESRENAGVFVTKTSNLMTVAAKGGRVAAGPDLTKMNPDVKRNTNGNGSMAPPPKQNFGRDRSIGQTVTIRKGGYKGLLGIVKDTTDMHARVELHTKGKIITVPKADLLFKDKITGRVIDINGRGGGAAGRGGFGSSRGGFDSGFGGGSRTPQVSSGSGRTPAWGSSGGKYSNLYFLFCDGLLIMHITGGRTPAWSANSGGRTPAWGSGDGSRTVNPYDGSRTAYGNYGSSGSRTPAWSSGAKTPAPDGFSLGSKTPAYGGSGSGDTSAWGAGSKTPGYGVSAPTPGASDPWSSSYTPAAVDAPTPGAGLGAPTPGVALSAPTPGAYSAPTPGALNAPTPGAWSGGWGADAAPTPGPTTAPTPGATAGYYSAPTPGGYGAAETPAASGPRYTDDD